MEGPSRQVSSGSAAPIQAILFDLGNVLVDFDHRIAARRIAHFCDKTPQAIYDLFFSSPATLLFEEGKISPEDFFTEIKKLLGLRLSYERFVPIWDEIFFFTPENLKIYNLANQLNKRYKVALISNINILHYEYLKRRFPVFDVFCAITTSFEAGAVKPDERIYRKALSALQVSPENALYTDDREELIEGARGLGIRGFVFKDIRRLKNDFFNSGIAID